MKLQVATAFVKMRLALASHSNIIVCIANLLIKKLNNTVSNNAEFINFHPILNNFKVLKKVELGFGNLGLMRLHSNPLFF